MMKILRLPSNKAFLLNEIEQNYPSLMLLPFMCEQFSASSEYLAVSHYKSASIYNQKDIKQYATSQQKIQLIPIIKQEFLKKLECLDVYCQEKQTFCIISDKFGDMYRININENQEKGDHKANYMNSNLGIPRYIKYYHYGQKYLILGDEEKRIKVYNSENPHEILTIWHMTNIHSVQTLLLQDKLLFLMKYFDPLTLLQQVQLHWLFLGQIEKEEYPGRKITISSKFDKDQCKFYTLIKLSEQQVILLLLTQKTISYQIIQLKGNDNVKSTGSHKTVQIEEGKWDFLDAIDISSQNQKQILVAYGQQVQLGLQLPDEKVKISQDFSKQSLNKYEQLLKIKL